MATLTYNVSKTVNAGQAWILPNTDDLTGRTHTVKVTSDGYCNIEIQNLVDGTWETLCEGKYKLNKTTDLRSIWCDGEIRITILSLESSASQDISVTITSYEVGTDDWISPEDVWRTAGIDANVVARGDVMWFIERAVSEVEDSITKKKWTPTTVTETYEGDESNTLVLDNYPVISLTSLTIDGTSITPANVDIWKDTGKILLTDEAEETKFKTTTSGERLIEATYVYGTSEVPSYVKRLTECIAAVSCLIHQVGGTYNDFTNFQIGDVQANLGEPWVNIDNTIKRLKQDIDRLVANIRPAIHMF